MSRTYRNYNMSWFLRRPKTLNEIKSLSGLLHDLYLEEYKISGVNHLQHRLANCPTAWDDIRISACYEYDYKHPN